MSSLFKALARQTVMAPIRIRLPSPHTELSTDIWVRTEEVIELLDSSQLVARFGASQSSRPPMGRSKMAKPNLLPQRSIGRNDGGLMPNAAERCLCASALYLASANFSPPVERNMSLRAHSAADPLRLKEADRQCASNKISYSRSRLLRFPLWSRAEEAVEWAPSQQLRQSARSPGTSP